MRPSIAVLCLAVLSASAEPFRGTLVGPEEAGEVGEGAVVLRVTGQEHEAALQVRSRGLALYYCYWIDIGRHAELAAEHPEWMASLQGHREWRRFFPGLAPAGKGEVVKNFPWVPVLYQEAAEAHLRRVEKVLRALPPADGIFLNHLQGGPSACGCGNPLCRWTADYGPIRTATPLPPDAAARFVGSVRALAPNSTVIPVWLAECEEQDRRSSARESLASPGPAGANGRLS